MDDKHPSSEIPVVIPNLKMTVEEASMVLKEEARSTQSKIIDDVHPWWQTLRWPLTVLSIAFAVLSLSVIFLSLTLRQATEDRDREYREDACFDRFNVLNDEAVARVRASATEVDNAGWAALVNSANGVEVTQDVVDNVEILVAESAKALETERVRVQERKAWIDAGRPLPCPVS